MARVSKLKILHSHRINCWRFARLVRSDLGQLAVGIWR